MLSRMICALIFKLVRLYNKLHPTVRYVRPNVESIKTHDNYGETNLQEQTR